MNRKLLTSPALLWWSLNFYRNNFLAIAGVSLLASIGRSIQLGAVGEVPSFVRMVLEAVTGASRLLVLVLVIGDGSFGKGFRIIQQVLAGEGASGATPFPQSFDLSRNALLLTGILYVFLALLVNLSISYIANQPALLKSLHSLRLLDTPESAAPLIFFLKNLTIIPFTIIFMYALFRALIR